jgi:hypothetical protein
MLVAVTVTELPLHCATLSVPTTEAEAWGDSVAKANRAKPKTADLIKIRRFTASPP